MIFGLAAGRCAVLSRSIGTVRRRSIRTHYRSKRQQPAGRNRDTPFRAQRSYQSAAPLWHIDALVGLKDSSGKLLNFGRKDGLLSHVPEADAVGHGVVALDPLEARRATSLC